MSTQRVSRRRILQWARASLAAAAFAPAGNASAANRVGREKVLFDSDIGSDIDDAVALAYLLAQPRCELLGITTVTGEASKRAELASALCHAAGKRGIPIFAGAEQPLLIEQAQPTAEQFEHIGAWRRESRFVEHRAVEFMQDRIRRHPGEVTLLAVGALTNVALLCRIDPEAISLLKRIVLMSGVFAPAGVRGPDGNVSLIEWNVWLDPHAAAIVIQTAKAPVRMYPLDVTMQVVLSRDEFHARMRAWAATRPILDFAQAWFNNERNTSQLHDPLAATGIFNPSICTLQRGRASVNVTPGAEFARTTFAADPAGPHELAVQVDPSKFFDELFTTFEEGRRRATA